MLRAHFDEANRLANSSAGDAYQAVTCSNCPSYVSDFAGTAVEFDGVNDQLITTARRSNTAWTVGIWMNPTATDSVKRAILGNRASSGAGFPVLYLTSNRKLALAIYQFVSVSGAFRRSAGRSTYRRAPRP